MFAVGPKFGLGWVDTRAHFRDHLVGLVDASKRGADVQPEAGDVASHLRPDGRNLVALPEDLGLMAVFSGSRGEQARGASSVVEAIVAVLGAYAPQTAYYSAKFPSLAQRGLPTRVLALAATDTFARVAVETFAEIAQTHHVWLEAGVNMAQDWRIVCVSKATMPKLPGGATCDQEDPARVAQLQTTDEPDRPYAYEATTAKASNMALLFDPSGRLVSRQVKTYLTPIELPGQLDLLPGDVFGGLSAVRTPIGTLGFVTSKDAWMPDVTARLDEQHVDLLVQPEFFVGDTIRTTGPWAPDNIQGAGYSDVLRHPSFEALVLPELTGNLFDLSADNQQAIVTKPRARRGGPRGFLVGQPAAAGFLRVGDWVAQDPAVAGETIAATARAAGRRSASSCCPTTPTRRARPRRPAAICRGGQVEDVIFADVRVARRPRLRRVARRKHGRTPFTVNRPLAPARAAQRNVALAARGRLVVAAFEQRTRRGDRVLVARSTDGGRRWSAPGAARRRAPRLVARGRDRPRRDRLGRLRRTTRRASSACSWPARRDGGRTFARPVAADGSVGDGVAQLRPAIAGDRPRAGAGRVRRRPRALRRRRPPAGGHLGRARARPHAGRRRSGSTRPRRPPSSPRRSTTPGRPRWPRAGGGSS